MDIHVTFLSNLHFFKLFFAKFLTFYLFIFSPASAFVPAAKKSVAMQILAGLQPGKTYLCKNSLHAQVTSVNTSRSMRKGMDYHMYARHHPLPCHRLTGTEYAQGW